MDSVPNSHEITHSEIVTFDIAKFREEPSVRILREHDEESMYHAVFDYVSDSEAFVLRINSCPYSIFDVSYSDCNLEHLARMINFVDGYLVEFSEITGIDLPWFRRYFCSTEIGICVMTIAEKVDGLNDDDIFSSCDEKLKKRCINTLHTFQEYVEEKIKNLQIGIADINAGQLMYCKKRESFVYVDIDELLIRDMADPDGAWVSRFVIEDDIAKLSKEF